MSFGVVLMSIDVTQAVVMGIIGSTHQQIV
jgi:hypothetical protein